MKKERALIEVLLTLAAQKLIGSAHDVADGGLAVALAECCFGPMGNLGAAVEVDVNGIDRPANLFGEGASSVILSVPPEAVAKVEQIVAGRGLEYRRIGTVLKEPWLRIDSDIQLEVAELRTIYEQALPRRIQGHG